MTAIPIVERDGEETFARLGTRSLSIAEFCADVSATADVLPQACFVVNLCQDRYQFTVSFFAALTRGQTTLLPSRREIQFARELSTHYSGCSVISDADADGIDVRINIRPGANGTSSSPTCAGEHHAAVAFTSGSTGEPQAHIKSWRMLDTWRKVHRRYLPGAPEQLRGLVATVPSWHMYGLEWAMMLPTVAPLILHCGADFYPQDVIAAVTAFTQPCVLVSTPLHLRALGKQTKPAGNLSAVLSATAPLEDALTERIEQRFATQLFEIYGCSEVGSLASRYPSRDKAWTFFDCFKVRYDKGSITVEHPELAAPVTLADRFKQLDGDHYELEGRNSDIVKIAGKRESLANLNGILLNLDGVEDGIIYDPSTFGLPHNGRLAALVVAPELTSNTLRAALARQIDAAFLPRPIRMVDKLPRESTSKLKRAELARLIAAP